MPLEALVPVALRPVHSHDHHADRPSAPDRALESSLCTLAAEVAARSPWRPPNPADPERTFELVDLTDIYEVWAIHWPTGGHLELHDHGGSAGALFVARGALEESRLLRPASLLRRTITAGRGVEVPPSCLHDVRNTGPTLATSVHVYSPPLSHMNFYAHEGQEGRVRRQRTEYRAEPTWNR